MGIREALAAFYLPAVDWVLVFDVIPAAVSAAILLKEYEREVRDALGGVCLRFEVGWRSVCAASIVSFLGPGRRMPTHG